MISEGAAGSELSRPVSPAHSVLCSGWLVTLQHSSGQALCSGAGSSVSQSTSEHTAGLFVWSSMEVRHQPRSGKYIAELSLDINFMILYGISVCCCVRVVWCDETMI